jgi:hypothetical protein
MYGGVVAITIGPGDGQVGLLTGALMVWAYSDNVEKAVPLAELRTIDGKVTPSSGLPPTSAANRAWVAKFCT